MRTLKYHEQKLLKKVDFLQWKHDHTLKENQILRRYHITNRDDYIKYNRICGLIHKLAHKLEALDSKDPYRIKMTGKLIDHLFKMGVIATKKTLLQCAQLPASAFCRRRLPVVMVRLKMAETTKEAVVLIEQGHVRVGPEVMRDPAFLVTRTMEDFVTWVDNSKIRKNILKFHDKLDDYELLGN